MASSSQSSSSTRILIRCSRVFNQFLVVGSLIVATIFSLVLTLTLQHYKLSNVNTFDKEVAKRPSNGTVFDRLQSPLLWSSNFSSAPALSKISSQEGRKELSHVDCTTQLLTKDAPNSNDPNAGMAESPKRWVNATTPPFWISLHKKWFDMMRWTSIMNNGNYYESGITHQFHQILGTTSAPGRVIDIGMNIGWFTIYSRAHGHHVASFEPNSVMHTRVCESLVLNKWHNDSSVKMFPYGLGERKENLTLTMGKNPGGSSFVEQRLAPKYRKYVTVKVVTLDSIATEEGWMLPDALVIHLMKVDVEGFEPFVFRGGKQLLQSGKIQNIIMENTVLDLRQSIYLLSSIAQAGYVIELLSDTNGNPNRGLNQRLPEINKAFSKTLSPGMDLDAVSDELKLFSEGKCKNIWWKKA